MAERGTPEWFDETPPDEQRRQLAADGIELYPSVELGAMGDVEYAEYVAGEVDTGRLFPAWHEKVRAKYRELYGEEMEPEPDSIKGEAGTLTDITPEDDRTSAEIGREVAAVLMNAKDRRGLPS